MDGALVFNGSVPGADPFDLNSVSPSSIEAIEVYASAAQMPAMLNRPAKGCGAIMIWTRRR